MVAIRIDEYRARMGVTVAEISNELLVLKLATATRIAQRIAQCVFGHAVELVEPDSSDAIIRVYRHGLPASGKVYLTGIGIAGLTGIVSYTRINADSIRVSGVTVASVLEATGMLAIPKTETVDLLEGRVRLRPGPLVGIEELRVQNSNWEDEGAFPTANIIDPELYYQHSDGEYNWTGEVQISTQIQSVTYRRRPGMIGGTKVPTRRSIQAKYFVGCAEQVPEDIVEAIGAIAKNVTTDPMGNAISESYDYYSVSKVSPSELEKVPTSAIATLASYRSLV